MASLINPDSLNVERVAGQRAGDTRFDRPRCSAAFPVIENDFAALAALA